MKAARTALDDELAHVTVADDGDDRESFQDTQPGALSDGVPSRMCP